jgi:ribosomal protein S18 acetylase RimI-like enzyme
VPKGIDTVGFLERRPFSVDYRDAQAADEPFLEDMLRLAAGWREDVPTAVTPDIEKYVRGYGRSGDHGIVAVAGGTAVAAAWYRYFTGTDRGYGYIADDIPELSLAVQPQVRRLGLGRGLLVRLLTDAAARRLPGLSLSVEPDNPARRLYEQLGFERTSDTGAAWTMFRATTPSGSPRLAAGHGRS